MQDKQEKRKLAIEVDNVQKIYKLYDKPSDRMKEAFGLGKKTKHKLHYALKGAEQESRPHRGRDPRRHQRQHLPLHRL